MDFRRLVASSQPPWKSARVYGFLLSIFSFALAAAIFSTTRAAPQRLASASASESLRFRPAPYSAVRAMRNGAQGVRAEIKSTVAISKLACGFSHVARSSAIGSPLRVVPAQATSA
ncbi:MAG: hypothetical protein QOF48_3281 [Verrucomicrobiota bacterium]